MNSVVCVCEFRMTVYMISWGQIGIQSFCNDTNCTLNSSQLDIFLLLKLNEKCNQLQGVISYFHANKTIDKNPSDLITSAPDWWKFCNFAPVVGSKINCLRNPIQCWCSIVWCDKHSRSNSSNSKDTKQKLSHFSRTDQQTDESILNPKWTVKGCLKWNQDTFLLKFLKLLKLQTSVENSVNRCRWCFIFWKKIRKIWKI